jgi:NAD-dependent deacetylase
MISETLFKRLYNATDITVMTGKNLSEKSGLIYESEWGGYPIEKITSLNTLENNPEIFWKYINHIKTKIKGIKPNLGHYSLVDMERFYDVFTVITDNIDGLHQAAGSKKVLQLNGNVNVTYCSQCKTIVKENDPVLNDPVPKCAKCGGLLRPNIRFTEEKPHGKALKEAQDNSSFCEVFFLIGIDEYKEPASNMPYISKANGSYLIEINENTTELSSMVNEFVKANPAEILPKIALVLDKLKSKG